MLQRHAALSASREPSSSGWYESYVSSAQYAPIAFTITVLASKRSCIAMLYHGIVAQIGSPISQPVYMNNFHDRAISLRLAGDDVSKELKGLTRTNLSRFLEAGNAIGNLTKTLVAIYPNDTRHVPVMYDCHRTRLIKSRDCSDIHAALLLVEQELHGPQYHTIIKRMKNKQAILRDSTCFSNT
uniref:AlNc14C38G3305 protein n=1 Tax=Albugo laibachii Nc14 TaxID=890382 RepID=F0W934_9STRA|nr:AlNc14C38G3305 [Albugo laibachii Nc14]|eukprot:CCA17646.1 AlNc14C38G3305 [Albugo laibachii Nc14]